jgi:ABC-type nitrate/sulfonate/bicarbonate transport system ATPase subunit
VKLDVLSVVKRFRRTDGGIREVLGGLTFTVPAHGFVCLVGPSGCGKSTILNILAGLMQPDAGEIRIDGQRLNRRIHRIGYVFQRPRLLNWKTVQQNVEFVLRPDGLDAAARRARARETLALVGLEQFANDYPLVLSGGMQQRVAIARALAIEPQILLMDEPFSHLDELTARAQRKELLRFFDKISATIVFVTHNALEAAYLADRIDVLSPRPTQVVEQVVVEDPRSRAVDDPYVIGVQRTILRTLGVE